MSARGLLLINLGTPDAPNPPAVRRYLAEFLMDPLVIDIPWPLRFALVYGSILPRRPRLAAEAYRKIWTSRGSPLAFHLEDLGEKTRRLLAPAGVRVMTAMRYGKPSIAGALARLRGEGVSEVVAFPLYPQYSLSATESSALKTRREARRAGFDEGAVRFVPPFFAEPGFIRALADEIRCALSGFQADHVLFSFHGLPERHVRKLSAQCLPGGEKGVGGYGACCEKIGPGNARCYRAQSFATTQALARELALEPARFSVSFQSRLGRTPWLKPYTDEVLIELAARGVKRLAVACPSFVADCLETLEEIGIRGREAFLRAGGEELRLVPCLNASDAFARAVCELMETAK